MRRGLPDVDTHGSRSRVREAGTWRVAVARRSLDGGSRQPAAIVTCRAYEVAAVR